MTTTIIGLFDREQTAQDIKDHIQSRHLNPRHLDAITSRSLSEGRDPSNLGQQHPDQSPTAQLADQLHKRGVPADDAREFAEAVRRGGNLVVTEVADDQHRDEIANYMNDHDAIDLADRRQSWENDGYTGFDPSADLYTSDQIDGDRPRDASSQTDDAHPAATAASPTTDELPAQPPPPREPIDVDERAQQPVADSQAGGPGGVDQPAKTRPDQVGEPAETHRQSTHESGVDIDELAENVPEGRQFSAFHSDYRAHYDQEYAADGQRYKDYEPAYRYGHVFGATRQSGDREYDDVEPELRSTYETQHGVGTFDRYRGAARHGFETARRATTTHR